MPIIPSIRDVQDKTEKLEDLVTWISGILRSKNPVKKLLLLEVVILLFLNETVLSYILGILGSVSPILDLNLPNYYPSLFWAAVVLIFLTAVAAASRMPTVAPPPPGRQEFRAYPILYRPRGDPTAATRGTRKAREGSPQWSARRRKDTNCVGVRPPIQRPLRDSALDQSRLTQPTSV